MQRFDPNRSDFQPYGFTCELWKAAPMKRPDRHNEIELNLLGTGSLTYLLGGKKITIPERSLCAFWAAMPHQILAATNRPHYYVVTIPLAWFLQCRLPTRLVDKLMHGHCLMDYQPKRYDLDWRLFQSWETDLPVANLDQDSAIGLELKARLRRLSDGLPDSDRKLRRSSTLLGEGGLNKVEKLAAHIAKHYQEPIRIDDVARDLGLHPNYAMNLFKKTFKITINDYITQQRLSHAQRLLATTDEKVINIANESGYSTLSRFYEAFKKSCGCTPSAYRKDHRLED